GHEDAKEICSKIAAWISTKTGNDPSKIVDGYNIDGTETSRYNNATFVGPFACAGMVDESHKSWLDKAYEHLNSLVEVKDVYYQQSLKVITLLFLSGNMPNFWDMPSNIDYLKKDHITTNNYISVNSNNIKFSLEQQGKVKIFFHTMDGKVSKGLYGYYPKGSHKIELKKISLPKGIYIVSLIINGKTIDTQKIVLY
ncbi:MAG: T9SS type A sorting domain-containing protein, partial [Chitinispirillaceae bacterium]|nr:T9SS type A sorting domain-containing protein [Chitinispirillaceae bacterium]